MPIFLDPQALLLFDVPLFLLLFGAIFLLVRLVFRMPDPVLSSGIAAFAGGAAFILVRSQFVVTQWILFNPKIFWGLFILVFILVVIYWMLKI